MSATLSSSTAQPSFASTVGDAVLAAAGRGVVKAVELTTKDVVQEVGRMAKQRLAATASKTSRTSTAKKTSSSKKTTTPKTTKGYATKRPGEFDFLSDPKMSIEEKIFRFMKIMSKRSEDDLVKKMKEFQSEKKTSAKSSGGGGVWSALKTAVPGLAVAEKLLGDQAFSKLAKELSGPALAAAVTAVGFPELAPVALKLGPELVAAAPGVLKALDEIGIAPSGAAASSSSGALGASSDGKKTLSKEEAMELEFMMQQQQQLFTSLSNVMKSMHDTKMAVIGNIR